VHRVDRLVEALELLVGPRELGEVVRAVRLGRRERERLSEEAHDGRVVVCRVRSVEPAAQRGEGVGRAWPAVDGLLGVGHASSSSFVTRLRLRP